MMVSVKFEITLPSAANLREHWKARHRRVRTQRWLTEAALREIGWPKPRLPVAVHLTRIAPRKLDSDDNLNISMKSVRDQVARWLGVDDGSDQVRWHYHQRKGEPGQTACEIRFEEVGDA